MKDTRISLSQWVGKFLRGDYDSPDRKTQCNAGWYDWFCKDSSLASKTKSLGKKVLQIYKSKKFDPEKVYVWFKNNCPCVGRLYDDFRIADLKTGDVLYTIVPSSGHKIELGEASVWGKENKFEGALVEGTWKDIVNWFLK